MKKAPLIFFNSLIKKHSLAIFSITLFAIFIVIPIASKYSHQRALHKEQLYQNELLLKRYKTVLDYLDQNLEVAKTVSRSPQFIDYFKSGSKELPPKEYLRTFQDLGFKMLLFADREGNIFEQFDPIWEMTQKKEKSNATLSQSIERASITLTTDISYYEYNTETKKPVLYCTIPVIQNLRTLGFVIIKLDDDIIKAVTRDLNGLGKTREIVLSKTIDTAQVIVTTSRRSKYEAFKSVLYYDYPLFAPLFAASTFIEGHGLETNVQGERILSTWDFIPIIDLNGTINTNLSEIFGKYSWLWKLYFILTFSCACLCIFALYYVINGYFRFVDQVKQQNRIKRVIQFLTGVTLFFIIGAVYDNFQKPRAQREALINSLKNEVDVSTAQLAETLNAYQTLHTDILGPQSTFPSQETVDSILDKNRTIIGFVLHEKKSHNTTYIHRIDSVAKNETLDSSNRSNLWATKEVLSTGWSKVFYNPIERTFCVAYTQPVGEDQGIMSIVIPTSVFRNIIQKYQSRIESFYSVTYPDGEFFYHPVEEYVDQKTTLTDLAEDNNTPSLLALKKALDTQTSDIVAGDFDSTGIYKDIPNTSLTLVYMNSPKVTSLQKNTYNTYLIIEACILGILLSFLIGKIHKLTIISIGNSLLCVSIFLLTIIVGLWVKIYQNQQSPGLAEPALFAPVYVNLFIDQQVQKAKILHEEPPRVVRVGTMLNTISIQEKLHQTQCKGIFWYYQTDKIHNTFPMISNSFTISSEQLKKEDSNSEDSRLWEYSGMFDQKFSYPNFPFDKQTMSLTFVPKDITDNVLLIPSIQSYRFMSPSFKPGLNEVLSSGEFLVSDTYFTIQPKVYNVNFGNKETGKSRDYYELSYNILVKRNIINALIIHLLPLLIILIINYFTFYMMRWEGSTFQVSSGLLLALILLHRNLRITLGKTDIIYFEYLILSSYILLAGVLAYSIIYYRTAANHEVSQKMNRFVTSMYWPVTFTMWIGITLAFFS